MRKQIVAGNWKMNTLLHQGIALAENLIKLIDEDEINSQSEIIIGVPYTHISHISHIVNSYPISVSAQNCSVHESGAYTGEVSAQMISSCGASHCIVGHSERRLYHQETDELIASKVRVLLKNKMIPIFCCGESLAERENNLFFKLVESQISNGLFHLSKEDIVKVIIAYEPVWAIGTGLTASPNQAQEMHHFIRSLITQKFDSITANNISILYGGSCKPSNAKDLFSQPDIDGGLIGGASLIAADFAEIINAN
jgi:triosephosphate isomerase